MGGSITLEKKFYLLAYFEQICVTLVAGPLYKHDLKSPRDLTTTSQPLFPIIFIRFTHAFHAKCIGILKDLNEMFRIQLPNSGEPKIKNFSMEVL